MPTLRTLTLALALTGLFSNSLYAAESKSASPEPVRVLASLPITYGLGQILLKDSGVVLERAAAANLPGSRQTAYFTGRGAEALRKLSVEADAVIGLRSIWSDDPLYPNARRSNIRIVEIDAARPVDGSLPGIALQPGQNVDGLNSQPWLASNNMGRMADVMAADLVRLAPAAKPKIEANLAALKQQLLKLSAASEARLASADNLSVVSLSDRFGYLISGLNLELIDTQALTDEQWTPEALAKLTTTLKENDVALVLDHRQPPESVKAAVTAAGSQLLVLGIDGEDPLAELQGNIEQVITGLSGKG
ncbi:zinc ABC transporter substrate-binding protein [Pseudomonas cichorii]|nr:zinc ABC transporter substrate-binding protein [Pseudomonas cichorii]MBX8511611.1 zinc ABC transporter substrate-binding protein [Pseudomonas cichorii]MBX8523156.1 zinc ABC transporter substrate-binding protein [Pseudomonas cichorii]MBX8549959.1 zinc ABC transporter substrate-binding protein [Pseudomonas cichorii]MBX8584606.1 zinc ABC transporter substrate-binding protein [Pseudomonas cichorii]